MRQYSPIDVALDDDLFYSYRLSMGVFDSLISKDEEEKIKNVFQIKKSSKNNDIDLYRQEFLRKFNSNENGLASEVFTETNNFLSCIGKLNNQSIHLLFQFNEIITSTKASSKLIFAGNESVLYNLGTDENCECKVLPIDSSIIGFVDYIDTRNDTMKSFLSKFNKKISDLSPFLDNKHKNNKNEFITYIKLLLRVSFIKSICLLKMYGKILPIYLFDGSQLLIKIEPMFNFLNDGCMISYKVINEQIDSSIMKVDLNYHQFKWFYSWKKIFKISNNFFLFQNDYPYQLSPNKKLCMQNINSESSLTPPRKVINILNDENPKGNLADEKPNKKMSSPGKIQESQKDIFSEEENEASSRTNDESSPAFSSLSKTTNDVINELLNKPNSNILSSKQKKKRSKQSESSDIENSQDYVDKLIQQQTMQLFDL
ncbi:uncharacterized protein cubi_03491 [Cryptosporidium ubiquitum]|uniref:Uncharacterized protein n=1 Tax=Cryptosporidium ubiquitum TaxID=857276 RepID=A0A1J4MLE5_9CRYT|nr:uncharacterized protein cubi_03491 [Cryptosporidium ubiquitum]OII73693.1 hypothetical protein cubi_03491 [Cryptosporidium ubiquitum]